MTQGTGGFSCYLATSAVSLNLVIQLDVIHEEEVTDGCTISKQVSTGSLVIDLVQGVETYTEQQRGQSITSYLMVTLRVLLISYSSELQALIQVRSTEL